jgi:hypothetical protein
MDKEENRYLMEEITDKHLINILNYLGEGMPGHEWFVDQYVIRDLIHETFKRKLIGLNSQEKQDSFQEKAIKEMDWEDLN